MPAYMIALNRSVHDRQKLEAYWKAAGPTFEGRGAKFLSSYKPLEEESACHGGEARSVKSGSLILNVAPP